MVLGVRGLGVTWLRPGRWTWSAKGSAGFAEEGSDRSELGLARSSEPEYQSGMSRLKIEWHPSTLRHRRMADGLWVFRNQSLRVKQHFQKWQCGKIWTNEEESDLPEATLFFSRKKEGEKLPKIKVFLLKRCRGCKMLRTSKETIVHMQT